MKQLYTLIFTLGTILAFGQTSSYSFEDCSGTDDIGVNDAILMGTPECRCGVVDSALQFDGVDDYLDFPLSINPIFQGSFTISFYFWVQNSGSDPVDLVSYMKACDRDSMFNISFVPVTNQVIVEVSQQSGISSNLRGDLNPDQCWHFVSFN